MGSKYNHVCQALDVSNINSSASQGFCTQYNQCCYFYKFHGLLSHTDESDCNLRNPNLKLPHFNLDLERTSLRYIEVWNCIPISLKQAPSISYFKYALRNKYQIQMFNNLSILKEASIILNKNQYFIYYDNY